MDPLLRGRHGDHLLRGHVGVRPGPARGRDDGEIRSIFTAKSQMVEGVPLWGNLWNYIGSSTFCVKLLCPVSLFSAHKCRRVKTHDTCP